MLFPLQASPHHSQSGNPGLGAIAIPAKATCFYCFLLLFFSSATLHCLSATASSLFLSSSHPHLLPVLIRCISPAARTLQIHLSVNTRVYNILTSSISPLLHFRHGESHRLVRQSESTIISTHPFDSPFGRIHFTCLWLGSFAFPASPVNYILASEFARALSHTYNCPDSTPA